MSTLDLHGFVNATLGHGGYLTTRVEGFRPSVQQMEYAHRVADTLLAGFPIRPPAVSILEAETGTGKSLGYLVPLLGWAALYRKRVAVSTFTVALQLQLLEDEGDLALAQEAVTRLLGGTYLKASARFGMRNYLAASRALALLNEQLDLGKDDPLAHEFRRWLIASGPKLAHDWISRHERFPFGFAMGEMALNGTDSGADLAEYRHHVVSTLNCDVLVCNHATLVMYLLGRLDTGPLSAVVADEADRLRDAAEGVLAQSASLDRLRSMARKAREKSVDDKLQKNAQSLIQHIEHTWSLLAAFRRGQEPLRILDTRDTTAIATLALLRRRFSAFARSVRQLELDKTLGADWREAFETAFDRLDALGDYTKKDDDAPAKLAITWSPVKGYPSFEVVTTNAGRIVGNLIRDSKKSTRRATGALVLTSATFVNGHPDKLLHEARGLGIFDDNCRVIATQRFSPSRFGQMRFVLARVNAPLAYVKSTNDDDDRLCEENPEWERYVGGMISAAAESGGRILALHGSYRDSERVFEVLSQNPVLAPRLLRTTSSGDLAEMTRQFRRIDGAILLTAAGWEGLNLPGLVNELVITRLPFVPPDNLASLALEQILLQRGKTPSEARGTAFAVSRSKVIRKFRQGLGRGIRREQDSVRVWIADPRFQTSRGFKEAVPERFRRPGLGTPSALESAAFWP